MRSHHKPKVNTTGMMILAGLAWLMPLILPWSMTVDEIAGTKVNFSWNLLAPNFERVGAPGFLLLIPGMAVLGLVVLLLGALLRGKGQAIAMLIVGAVALLIQILSLVLLGVFPDAVPTDLNTAGGVFAIIQFVGAMIFLAPVLTLIHVRAFAFQSNVPRILLGIASGIGIVSLLPAAILGIGFLAGVIEITMPGIVVLYLGLAMVFLVLLLFAGYLLSILDVFMPKARLTRFAALALYLAFVGLVLHAMILPVLATGNGGSMLLVLHMGLAMFGGMALMLGGGTVGLVYAVKSQPNQPETSQ
jgi:hypothetical protein